MKIAALSFYSADKPFTGHQASARSSANQYDYKRDGDRRRKVRVVEAARISPATRLTTGLALQVIAQIEKTDSSNAHIEAARAAYRRVLSAGGAMINFRA